MREGPGRLSGFRAPDGPKEPARAVHAGTRAEETARPRPSHQVRPAVSVWLRAPAPADWRCPGARCVHGRVLCVCDVHGRVLPASRAPPSPRRVPWAVGIGNQNARVFSRSSWLAFLSSVTTACACVRVCDGDRVCAQHQTPHGSRQGRVVLTAGRGAAGRCSPELLARTPGAKRGLPWGRGPRHLTAPPRWQPRPQSTFRPWMREQSSSGPSGPGVLVGGPAASRWVPSGLRRARCDTRVAAVARRGVCRSARSDSRGPCRSPAAGAGGGLGLSPV